MGVRGFGVTKEAAFEQAALALTAVITDPSDVRQEEVVSITCESPDDEVLLVDWLNGVIYEMATRRMLFGRYEVRIAGQHLDGEAWGEAVNPARHQPAVEVKGATYTGLRVQQGAEGTWIAECVVDV